MKNQLVIAVAVFTVGFAVGYGITWLLVSGGGPSDGARADVKDGVAAAAGGDQAGAGTATAGSGDSAGKGGEDDEPGGDEPAGNGDEPGGDDKAAGGGDDQIGTAPVSPKPSADAGAAVTADAAAPSAPSAPDAGATAATAAAEDAGPGQPDPRADGGGGEGDAPKSQNWWDQCVGKRCAVEWGKVRGGVSIREGSLQHGTRVDWKLRFGNAAKIDAVKANTRRVFVVKGVGLGMDGLPTCAEVSYKKGGKQVSGIIALKLGSKRISMVPVAPGK